MGRKCMNEAKTESLLKEDVSFILFEDILVPNPTKQLAGIWIRFKFKSAVNVSRPR